MPLCMVQPCWILFCLSIRLTKQNKNSDYFFRTQPLDKGKLGEARVKLHNVKKRIARGWCEKDLLEAKQINGAWLIAKDVAETFAPPK